MIDHEKRVGWPYGSRSVTEETRAKVSASLRKNKAALTRASQTATRQTSWGRKQTRPDRRST